jgi:hypothetical protein
VHVSTLRVYTRRYSLPEACQVLKVAVTDGQAGRQSLHTATSAAATVELATTESVHGMLYTWYSQALLGHMCPLYSVAATFGQAGRHHT